MSLLVFISLCHLFVHLAFSVCDISAISPVSVDFDQTFVSSASCYKDGLWLCSGDERSGHCRMTKTWPAETHHAQIQF